VSGELYDDAPKAILDSRGMWQQIEAAGLKADETPF
jgi:hypothetical protein